MKCAPNVVSVANTIELALATTGSVTALARALNVVGSHVSRLRKGLVGVGPEASLHLSYIIGRPALRGLREDGHRELADLLQAFFEFRDDTRAVAQRALDADLAALPDDEFRHVRAIVASLANAARRRAHDSRSAVSNQVQSAGE